MRVEYVEYLSAEHRGFFFVESHNVREPRAAGGNWQHAGRQVLSTSLSLTKETPQRSKPEGFPAVGGALIILRTSDELIRHF